MLMKPFRGFLTKLFQPIFYSVQFILSLSKMDETANANSWAEYVRTVDHGRKNLPWDVTKAEPVVRASMYEVTKIA